MADILTIGEILVEVMAKDVNQTFDQTGEFVGPFASGAPAIFINQAAKTGSSAGIISTIGEDAFGELNYKKLSDDGVDISLINKSKERTTGVAFVTYKDGGDRDFIFHIHHSSAALIGPEDIKKSDFENCQYFHVMGTSLFTKGLREAVRKAIGFCRETGTKISFDPNMRKELLHDPEMKEFLLFVLKHTDIFLPGSDELLLLMETSDEKEAVAKLLEQGVEYIVVKRGSKGCHAYSKDLDFSVESLKVVEVDPTGAGDCFAGTLISCLNQGMGLRQSVIYANTAGALAVTKKGPMEGNTTLEQLKAYII
ncbi:sugar kinase [Bacillus sp. EB01]|uniref:sugar kinase n=1 Tax=Bacillus sp. EB01 TaxID=1347086 RepID=UPI0005C60DE4|nr:sugar kinase [Bacillus sp. EB01]